MSDLISKKALKSISLETTTLCGAKCIMCPREHFNHNLSTMSMNDFELFFGKCAEYGINCVTLTGFGDPLCDPLFEKRLIYCKKNYPDILLLIVTTGQLLYPSILPFILEYIDEVRISNYGLTKETYESIHRGSLKFEECQQNIMRLINERKERKPFISMSFLALEENNSEMNDWKQYWEPLVDEITIWHPHNFSGYINSNTISNVSFGTNYSDNPKSCGRISGEDFMIHPNGDVSVCCFDFNRELIIGNLNQLSIPELFETTQYKAIEKIHTDNTFLGSGILCERCDQVHNRKNALLYSGNPERHIFKPEH